MTTGDAGTEPGMEIPLAGGTAGGTGETDYPEPEHAFWRPNGCSLVAGSTCLGSREIRALIPREIR